MNTIKLIAIVAIFVAFSLTSTQAKPNEVTYSAQYLVNVENVQDIQDIHRELSVIPGIKNVNITVESQILNVSFDPNISSSVMIERSLEDLGFEPSRLIIKKENSCEVKVLINKTPGTKPLAD